MAKKMLAPHPDSGTHHRGLVDLFTGRLQVYSSTTPSGYSRPGMEKVKEHGYGSELSEVELETYAQGDEKESFECGRENDPVMPNIWLPEGVLPGFKDISLQFFWVSSCLYCWYFFSTNLSL